MKNAIKRGQNQACLSYAERELFGATLKREYMKPAMRTLQDHMLKGVGTVVYATVIAGTIKNQADVWSARLLSVILQPFSYLIEL